MSRTVNVTAIRMMIMRLNEAITHEREVAKEQRTQVELSEYTDLNYRASACLECAKEHEQLAEWLTELAERREVVNRLEEVAEDYKDSLFGDGIRFALKVISEPRKRDWERGDK